MKSITVQLNAKTELLKEKSKLLTAMLYFQRPYYENTDWVISFLVEKSLRKQKINKLLKFNA